MWKTSVIDRVLGTIVGMVLGAMAGTIPMLYGESVNPGSTHWEHWVVLMVPAAIVGSVFGFMGGLRSIFGRHWHPPSASS
jgi:CDP-diglyceride synthetase